MTAQSLARHPVRHWYRDSLSCLQSTLATLALHAGHDPLELLGLAWEFRYHPGDVRAEEYYWPCPRDGDLASSLLRHHQVRSRWRVVATGDPVLAFAPLADTLGEGRLPVVAVDNYYLPFRPAYQDVHAAHLVVVVDIDLAGGHALVSDAQPPAHHNWLPLATLHRACVAASTTDEQDVFFSGSGLGGRWLDVELPAPGPRLTRHRLARVLADNAELLRRDTENPDSRWTGIAGLERYADQLRVAARSGDGRPFVEAYTVGWGMQAQAALHGELLRVLGGRWRRPELAEAGRRVELVAHRWTPVRVTAAHEHGRPARASVDIDIHTRRLTHAYHDALTAIDIAADLLASGPEGDQ